MRVTWILTVVGITGLSAGCAVGPDYERPKVVLPDQYISQSDKGMSQEAVDAELDTWWTSFDDPQLTRYVRLALNQNLDLAQASARVFQARAALGGATAQLLPSGNVSGQAARSYQSVETRQGRLLNAVPNYDRYGDQYEANISASWTLDLFGGLRRSREAAVAEYEAAQAGAIATRLAVAAQTADIYIDIRALQARLDIATERVETQQDLLALTRLLSDRGLAPEIQTQQIAATVSQVRAAIPVLQAGLDRATNALDVILGLPPGTHRAEFAATGPIPRSPELTQMGSPRDLLRRRPDLLVAERRLAASNAAIGAATAQYYPQLSLTGLLGSATTIGSSNLFTEGASQSAAVFGLRWRLFDFGRINAQIKQARGRNAEMLAAYRLTALQATEDVENAFSSLLNRTQQTRILSDGVDSLTNARDAQRQAYEKGVSSQISVLEITETLLEARDAKTQSQAEASHAAVAAYRALGGGWDHTDDDAVAKRQG